MRQGTGCGEICLRHFPSQEPPSRDFLLLQTIGISFKSVQKSGKQVLANVTPIHGAYLISDIPQGGGA